MPSNSQDAGINASYVINNTGDVSKRGIAVEASHTIDGGVDIHPANGNECMGFIAEDGVAVGDIMRIHTGGYIYILLEDGTAAVNGGWIRSSTTVAGRMTANTASPPAAPLHFLEGGHNLEAKDAGVDVLSRAEIHFN